MDTDEWWTVFHEHYPKARLECYRYEAHDHVAPRMFELEVLKMLQHYGMNAHFKGIHLETLEGVPKDDPDGAIVAVNAVDHVKLFLMRLLN